MNNKEQQIFEFRGVDSLYVAEVLRDDAEAYECGTPIHLAYVAEIGKSVDSATDPHYYDNKPMINVISESADNMTLTIAPPELKKLAMITGKSFDKNTGMYIDGQRKNKNFAIMYRTKGTDGIYRYVSRLKGSFGIPEETNQTENNGTDTTNTQISYTGIYTTHEFEKGIENEDGTWEKGPSKGIVVDDRYGLADVSRFFEQVQTPDTIKAKTQANQEAEG